MQENVLKSANNPYKAGVEDIVHFIKSEGFIPIQRNTFYEKIKVYWKIRPGVSVDMGFYDLVDAYKKFDGKREVFKFLLQPTIEEIDEGSDYVDLLHNKTIPGEIQREVYER
mgnify:CR=1 FL=1